MKVGLITNLVHENKYVLEKLGFTNADELMSATGGNTGNVAFVHSVKTLLANDYGIVHWGDSPEAVNKSYDMLVICCANQVGSHVDLGEWANRLEAFNLPVVLIGLGAQSNRIGEIPEVPTGTIRFLKVVQSLKVTDGKSNIITRGKFSTEVIQSYGFDSSPLGCPSLLTSSDKNLGKTCLRNQNERTYRRIMVPSGNPWHKSSVIESKLIDLVNQYHGEYVLQHPSLIFKILLDKDHNLTDEQINVIKKTYNTFDGIQEIKSWLIAHSVFFADAQNWLNYSRKFTSAIGPRYHGIALPIQVGVPGRVITIDSRTEELALTTGIPYISYEELVNIKTNEIADLSKWTQSEAEHFDKTREKNSRNYISFMKDNNMRVKDYIYSISGQN